ncbi:NAD-dependent protein deacetylase sirtuin-3-like isoform X2 [Penaeus japonicus]|uniref:NAD-dependent protein deacetylase sirtuin-3-like isoform X2 n=1 Tax=Penaeus japonicus TaxID=27405 RepID=UPI001C7129CD|nr:NAD-dependent protein deacetylase sirtuin-3-like isoform X2 [Penaeus japonicus]
MSGIAIRTSRSIKDLLKYSKINLTILNTRNYRGCKTSRLYKTLLSETSLSHNFTIKSPGFKPQRWFSHTAKSNPNLQNLEDVAKYIRDEASCILVMAGAGMSTPSGIPDFRSPGTGLYDNLQKYNLPYPEAIFDIHYFMMDQRPFLTLVAGVPDEKLMEAHGSFSTASCTLCGKRHDGDMVKKVIVSGQGPVNCESKKCKGKVKPDIVFFGENLPHTFWNFHEEVHFTDLLLVIGTSLEVYPFAGIADAVGKLTPRVLINRDVVGSFGSRIGDVVLNGDLVEGIWGLAKAIGWSEKLADLEKAYDVRNEE